MKIFVACSSKSHYEDIIEEISNALAQQGHDLVFGASSTGMMGICMKEFQEEKRNIISATVERYKDDLINIPSTEEYLCDTTFDRLKLLYQKADIILFLPGGSGTMGELFGILEEVRTIDIKNKLIIYNVPYKEGYFYDFFEELMDRFIKDNYNDESIKEYYKMVYSKEELLKELGEIK